MGSRLFYNPYIFGPPQYPPNIYQQLDAQKYTSFTFSSGNNISVWADQSGSNRSVVSNVGTATYVSSGQLGTKPCVSLVNSIRMTTGTNTYTLSDTITVAIVGKLPATPTATNWNLGWGHFRSGQHDNDICARVSSASTPAFTNNTTLNLHTNNNNGNCLIPFVANVTTIWIGTMTAGTTLYFEATPASTRVTTSTTSSVTKTIASGSVAPIWLSGHASGDYWNGYIGEIVYFQYALTINQIAQLRALLINKWFDDVYPLDLITSSALSTLKSTYSIKRLISSYTGPVVNIKRSSDNTTSDFYADRYGNLSTGSGTSISSWLGSSTGYVVTWYDQSGNGKHGTGVNNPTIDYVNKFIDFGSTGYFDITAGTVPLNTYYTIISKQSGITGSPSSNGTIVCGGTNSNYQMHQWMRSGTGYYSGWRSLDANLISSTVTWYNTEQVVSCRYGGATSSISSQLSGAQTAYNTPTYLFTNGRFMQSNTARSTTNTWNGTVGSTDRIGVNNAGTSDYLNGQMYHLCMFSAALTDSDKCILEMQSVSTEFPPAGLTGSSTTLANVFYGNFTYTITQSSSRSSTTYDAFHAFDKLLGTDGTFWSSNGGYNQTTGAYTGAASKGGVAGEWIQIQSSNGILANTYQLALRNDNSWTNNPPASWTLLGSNNGTSYTVLDTQTETISDWTRGVYNTYIISSPAIYTYYAIVIQSVIPDVTTPTTHCQIGEMKLVGP